ncbi:MAG: DDE-type integrase/transposase/recombinase [Mycobacterium sp.]
MKVKKRSYSQAKRDEIVDDVRQLGVCGSATKHGVAKGLVSKWASAAGVRREIPGAEAAALPDRSKRSVSTPEPRPRLVTQIASLAHKAEGERATGDVLPGLPRPVGAQQTMRSHVARLYTPSQKAATIEYALTEGVSAAAARFNVSRFSIYYWLHKSKKAAAGEGPALTSGPAPQEIEAQRDREILSEWHKHPGLGPSQIVNQLRRASVKVSVHTARRVMEDAGYRPPKVRREPHDQLYEAVRPNHMWHLDFVHRHINRTSTFTLILIDDCSRYVVGHGVDDAERAGMVIESFEHAVEQHGRPERVMHDKGSAFWSWRGISRFTELLVELGIDQVVAEHKEWNGKVEVFNANLHKELFDVQRFCDVAEMRRRLAAHLEWYNHSRTHHALGGLLVPADRYYGRVDEVLARIEAGAARDANDMLELRDRCLELFRVTSRGGVPEVWLLGKKLLGAANAA